MPALSIFGGFMILSYTQTSLDIERTPEGMHVLIYGTLESAPEEPDAKRCIAVCTDEVEHRNTHNVLSILVAVTLILAHVGVPIISHK